LGGHVARVGDKILPGKTLKGIHHLGDVGIDIRAILKLTFKQMGEV